MPSLLYRLPLVLAATLSATDALGFEHVCRYCQRLADDEASTGKAPLRYAPDRVVDVRDIAIDVTPDFAAKTIDATTTVTFAPISKPVSLVELNAVRLRVRRVTSDHQLAEHSSTDEKLKLLFAEPIPVGETVRVSIEYTAEPEKGLYFRTSDRGYPEGEDHIWTQGETHEAPHWFPCFDYPNERSTTEVTCRVAPDMLVLSNGRRVDESIDPATGLKAIRWRQDKPHVNYLVCLVAGYFHEQRSESRGVPLGFYAQPEFAAEAPNSFQDTAEILAYFEDEIGVPYPWDKYDQVTIRDYSWGGMENTTLTTLTHETIYSVATENVYTSRNLDAHELAHQWFGDYVTCKDWSHLWLNEGFATYYTHLYDGHKFGHDAMLYRLYRDAALKVLPDGEDDPRPIVLRRYDEAWEQFDYRAYPKGAWVLHMLRCRLGEDVFRRGVKLYLERHALSSVVTDDLRAALEEVSGESLDGFFDQWVYHAGAPRLRVKHDWLPDEKLLKVTVKQEAPSSDATLPFTFPVTLRAHVGGEVVDRRVDVERLEQDFYLSLPAKPDIVRFDPEYTLLADVDHKQPQAMLEKQLRLKGDVIGRVRAAAALGERRDQESTAALKRTLQEDPFYGVRIEASKALQEQHTKHALAALLASRDQADARVRLRVVKDLGAFVDDESRAALLRVADRGANPAVRSAAIEALAKHPGEEAKRATLRALRSETFQNQLAMAAARSIGTRRDSDLADPLRRELQQRRTVFPGRRYQEALVAFAKASADADDTREAYDWLVAALDDSASSVRLGALEALGELGDPRAAGVLASYAARSGKEALVAKKAARRLDEATPPTPEGLESLRELISTLQREQDKLRERVDQLDAAHD